MSVFEITKQATFDAAHHFPNEPEGSIYRRVHGHSFTVEATVRSEVLDAEHGWVADLARWIARSRRRRRRWITAC